MTKRTRSVALVVAIGVIILAIVSIEGASMTELGPQPTIDSTIPIGTATGERAPDFTLNSLDGGQVSLSDLRGKPVLVNFWATWCPFCVAELPDLEQVHRELGDSVVILTINRAESLDKQREFLSTLRTDFTFPFLLDSTDRVAQAYGVRAMPTSYILDANGVIVGKKLGQISVPELNSNFDRALASGSSTSGPSGSASLGSVSITDGIRHTVPLDDIISVLPKDRIPAIDNPKFVSAREGNAFIRDSELVLGLTINGESRAYPHKILNFHEIVNDRFGDRSVAVTFCPLCFTGIAFNPIINGEAVEFGVSGKLYNSDLVMYDRKTETYWSQITGQGIRGELAGQVLTQIPVDTIEWGEWKKVHPDTVILSTDTGFFRNYDRTPYTGYERDAGTYFPVANQDDNRLFSKAIVYGVVFGDKAKAYAKDSVVKSEVINDVFEGRFLFIAMDPETKVIRILDRVVEGELLTFEILDGKLIDHETSTEWSFSGEALSGVHAGKTLDRLDNGPHFWFAWAAFNTNSELLSE
ncbi:MAG: DUF3179 domain-containing (seleno)protein [Nitrososphaerales archaeon]